MKEKSTWLLIHRHPLDNNVKRFASHSFEIVLELGVKGE